MLKCSFKKNTGLAANNTHNNILAYKKNISILLFIFFYFLLTTIVIFLLKKNIFLLFFLSLGNFFISFLLSFFIYEKSVQNIFSPLGLNANNKIPKYSFFKFLYDILIRKNTLLRDLNTERMKKLGDIYVMFMGYRPVIVITSSKLAKKVSQEPAIYAKSNPIDLNMPYFYKWVGNNNIVLSNDSDWKRLREIIHKQLTATQVYFPTMCSKTIELAENIKKIIKGNLKSEILLNRWLKAFSLDIAGETLFGFKFNHLKEVSNPAIEAMDYIISEIFNPLRISFPLLNKLPTKANKKLDKSIQYIDNLVSAMREKYYKDFTNNNANLLQRLLNSNKEEKLTENELRNNIITLVLSSYETTQVSLSGALYHLAKYSDYQKLIRNESINLFPNIDQAMGKADNSVYEKFQNFDLLENFILESLRIYSPLANQNSRTVTQNTQLGEFNIKAGISLIINIHAIHMNKASWHEPNIFNPQRFHRDNRPDKFSFLPFGAGPRLCSGRNFTLLEQKIALCYLVRKFEISLPYTAYKVPIERTSFTGMPDNSFTLVFQPFTASYSTKEQPAKLLT